jgi:hypothetical protein
MDFYELIRSMTIMLLIIRTCHLIFAIVRLMHYSTLYYNFDTVKQKYIQELNQSELDFDIHYEL